MFLKVSYQKYLIISIFNQNTKLQVRVYTVSKTHLINLFLSDVDWKGLREHLC